MTHSIKDVMRQLANAKREADAVRAEQAELDRQEERKRAREEKLAMFRELVEAYYDTYGKYPWQGEFERW